MDQEQITKSRPWLAVGQEINALLNHVGPDEFHRFAQLFENKKQRWFFSGQGRSGLVAQMAAMRFMHLGYQVHYVGEVSAPSIRKQDGLLIISGSGETPISLSFARIAKGEGAIVAALSNVGENSLATLADITLPIMAGKSFQFGGSLFEQAALLLLDSLILTLAQNTANAYEEMRHRHTNLQ